MKRPWVRSLGRAAPASALGRPGTAARAPAVPRQRRSATRVETHALSLEAHALAQRIPRSPAAHCAARVDHPMPGNGGSIGKRGESVSNEARVLAESRHSSDLTVRGDAPRRHSPHDRVDARIRRRRAAAISVFRGCPRCAATHWRQAGTLPWTGPADALGLAAPGDRAPGEPPPIPRPRRCRRAPTSQAARSPGRGRPLRPPVQRSRARSSCRATGGRHPT